MSIGRVPGATGIQPSIVDAKGDLIVGTAADSVARLAVGTNDFVLTAASGEATGLKWAATSSPAYAWTSYTPSLTGLTTGNGTLNASYLRIGNKTMFVRFEFVFGSTSSVTAGIVVGLPSGSTINKLVEAKVGLNDAGANFHQGTVFALPSPAGLYVYADKADGTYLNAVDTSSTIPHTWATNDTIRFIIVYEEA